MTERHRALMAWIISGVSWDIYRPDQTLSAAVADLLADKKTRYPTIATLVLLGIHVAMMAKTSAALQKPKLKPVDTEKYEVLRNLGWPA